MGFTGDFLVFITMAQYDKVNKKKFKRVIEFLLDYAIWKMATYIYFNNGFECIRRNAEKLRKYPIVYEFLRRSAVENYRLYKLKNATLEELMQTLEEKNLESWLEADACPLFEKLLERTEDPILLADRIIHFQHTTGGLFDDDIEEERDYAERTIDLLFS